MTTALHPTAAASLATSTPWRAPRYFERRPALGALTLSAGVIATAAAVALAAKAASLDVMLSRTLTTLLLAATTAVLLTGWRGWRAVGFVGPRSWRDLWVLALPLVIALWPFAFGLEVTVTALLLAIVMEIPNSFCEEALFRGIVVRSFAGRPAWVAALVSGVAFGLLHAVLLLFGQPIASVLPLVVVTSLFGIGYAAVRIRTGTMWAPLVLHGGWNVAQNTTSAAGILGEDTATLILLAGALVMPVYGLLLLRGRRVQP